MKLLHLDSSIQGDASASRALSTALVETLKAADPSLEITYHDLAANPLEHLTLDARAGQQTAEIADEFLAADIVVIGAALYNFTVPSQLKAWVDRILIPGKTFRYTPTGAEGLAPGKRVIVALARGAIYSGDSPFATFEHAETLLRSVFSFIGVTNAEFIIAEGLAMGDDARRNSLEAALAQARQITTTRSAV